MVAAAEWWGGIVGKTADWYAAGAVIELPKACVSLAAMSSHILFVRDVFDALYKEIVSELVTREFALCHLNGNSGVGKSAFLWYFIIRTGIDNPESILLYETGVWVWEFRGSGDLRVVPKKKYPFDVIQSPAVTFHLIDQRVYPDRPIGNRALVAASPDDTNTKDIRKVRLTYTFYLPPWDRGEFGLLLAVWNSAANKMTGNDANDVRLKVKAADLVFAWYGGIPRHVWDQEVRNLTEKYFHSDVMKCLANTKLKNLSLILQSSHNAKDISWRLFHFNVTPGTGFREFQYTFCSEKVANLYAGYLCRTDVDKIRSFLEASQPFSEYSALRGFVFEQYVIGQALSQQIMVMPMVDTAHCQRCSQTEDPSADVTVSWIQCGTCLRWYHTRCVDVQFKFQFKYECANRQGEPKALVASPSGPGLVLRYYEGDLEDTLVAAGEDAIKYMWRPLRKNNAVFDFVLLPRTLGQVTVACTDHKPVLEATIKAQQALKAWRELFYNSGHPDNDETLLVFFLPPDSYRGFKFQKYRSSRKVSQKAIRGIVQCKVAVPVSGSPYVEEMSHEMDVVSLDVNLPGTWEEALGCIESEEALEDPPEKSLVQEKLQYWKRDLVCDRSELDDLEKIRDIADGRVKRKRLQSLCKMYKIRANATNEEMLFDLADLRSKSRKTA
ncbi:hypothetical protein SELMODRAFT_429045 [Selaginella moellendorffii]|uniref:Uncharacterized protein n=1 Tax=Selaginella moellendorffii TaxID=88036 RepID=D8T4W0_SELML|nr:hypothetical protein SELMODRAFT_429045 [Selaginella moellendorffii]